MTQDVHHMTSASSGLPVGDSTVATGATCSIAGHSCTTPHLMLPRATKPWHKLFWPNIVPLAHSSCKIWLLFAQRATAILSIRTSHTYQRKSNGALAQRDQTASHVTPGTFLGIGVVVVTHQRFAGPSESRNITPCS